MGANPEIHKGASESWDRPQPVVIIGKDRQAVLLTRNNGDLTARRYPHPPRKVSRDQINSAWDNRYLTINKFQPVITGSAPLRLSPPYLDFGLLDQGGVFSSEVTVENVSNSAVALAGVGASCGCTVLEGQKTPLLPGERREFRIKFNSQGKWGFQELLSVFRCTDGTQAVFKISGYVRTPGAIYPTALDFGIVSPTDPQRRLRVSVLRLGRPDQTVIRSVSGPEWVTLRQTVRTNPDWNVPEDAIDVVLNQQSTIPHDLSGTIAIEYEQGGESRVASIPVKASFVECRTRRLLYTVGDVNIGQPVVKDFYLPVANRSKVEMLTPPSGMTMDIIDDATRGSGIRCQVTPLPGVREYDSELLVKRGAQAEKLRIFIVVNGK